MQYGLHGFGYVADIVEHTSITALKIYGKTAEVKTRSPAHLVS